MADKIDKLTDEIAETFREVYEQAENKMLATVNKTLVETSAAGSYKSEQLAKMARLRKELSQQAAQSMKLLERVTKNAGKMAGIIPSNIKAEHERTSKLLVESAVSAFAKAVTRISRLEKVVPLYEAIFKQTQEGIANGLPIQTKSGKEWGYKEYMEMNVRTTIQHDIGEQQLKAGSDAGVVFYLCNVFGDCADDHKDYQGKYYYNAEYKSFNISDDAMEEINRYIKTNHLLSMQEVRDGDPWLSTRPNCRHKFTAVSIDQVLTMKKSDILKALKLERGTYRQANYDATQEQRYNERQIRFFKNRKEQNEEARQMVEKGSGLDNLYRQQAQKDNVLVRRWEMRQRKLIDSNPTLDRDYRRETRNTLLNDLGAKSELKRSER